MKDFNEMAEKIFVWEIETMATGIVFADSLMEAKHIVAVNLPEMYLNSSEIKVRVFPLQEWQRRDALHIFPEGNGIYTV